jgi:hypothetical protein
MDEIHWFQNFGLQWEYVRGPTHRLLSLIIIYYIQYDVNYISVLCVVTGTFIQYCITVFVTFWAPHTNTHAHTIWKHQIIGIIGPPTSFTSLSYDSLEYSKYKLEPRKTYNLFQYVAHITWLHTAVWDFFRNLLAEKFTADTNMSFAPPNIMHLWSHCVTDSSILFPHHHSLGHYLCVYNILTSL